MDRRKKRSKKEIAEQAELWKALGDISEIEKTYRLQYLETINRLGELPKCCICGKSMSYSEWASGQGCTCSKKCFNIWINSGEG